MSETEPSYAPYSPPERPPYSPSPYTPGPEPTIQPEEELSYEARAIGVIKSVVDREKDREKERYGGSLLGKARAWISRVGKRSEKETLDEVGEWKDNAKWKKWAKFGAKVAGGVGVAGAMIATGGAGAILTPVLWSAGVREAYDGILEAGEELGWGRKRSKLELDIQTELSQKIASLKEKVRSESISEEEFQGLVGEIMKAENNVISGQETNIKGERKGKLIRSVASTLLSVGTGLLAGVPLGIHDYDSVTPPHRVMWNLKNGGQFLYENSQELTNIADEVARTGDIWTKTNLYGQIGHILGHGLPNAEKAGLAAAGLYQLGRLISDFWPRQRKEPEKPYAPYNSYGGGYNPGYSPSPRPPYSSYSPDSGPDAPGPEPETEAESNYEDVSHYLETLDRGHLEQMNEGLPEMSENCSMAVCIPASYAEHRNIYHTLEQYLGQKDLDGQPLSPELFEINIIVNGPEDKKEGIDRTVAEINRFKNDHPEFKVNCISKVNDERTTIGGLRKDINDLALFRANKRGNKENPLYLVSNDADLVDIDDQYLAKAKRIFEENPDLKMFVGKDDFPEDEYRKYPYLLAARRLWQFTDIVMRHWRSPAEGEARPKKGQDPDFLPKTVGLNSFIRADSYARTNGYNPEAWVAEDLQLARDVASKDGARAIDYKNLSITSSPRRDIAMIEKGIPIVRAYDNFGQRETFREEHAKPTSLEKLKPESRRFLGILKDNSFIDRLNAEASAVINDLWGRFFWVAFDQVQEVKDRRQAQGRNADVDDLIKKYKLDDKIGGEAYRKSGAAFRRVMGFWGAEYKLEQDQHGNMRVKITDWSKLKKGLEESR